MIDYEKTIKDFFASVDAYLTKSMRKADDGDELKAIAENQRNIRAIAAGLPKTAFYANQCAMGIVPTYFGFAKRTSNNNSVNLAFLSVMGAIEKYYNWAGQNGYGLDRAKEELLSNIKEWNYAISDNFFKDIVFAFKSAKSFAARVGADNQKVK